MNVAYSKLLVKPGQTTPPPAQFLCQVTNVSECLPVQDQSRVSKYLQFHPFIFVFDFLVHSHTLESHSSPSSSSFPCACN